MSKPYGYNRNAAVAKAQPITRGLRELAAAICSAADFAQREHGQYWIVPALEAVGLDEADVDGPAASLARCALWSSHELGLGKMSWLEAEAMILCGWRP